MKDKEKNILNGIKIAAVGVGVALILTHSISEKLVEIALNREKPKLTGDGKKKMKGSGEKAEYVEAIIRGKEKLENSEYEDVDIKSQDGLKLTGHWKPCENPERIIVAMHGWRSSWAWDFGMLSGFWHDNQCSVLYAEQRGQGNSEGGYKDFCRTRYQMDAQEYSCLEAMEKCKTPVLFIHGTSDKFVPVEMTYANYNACNAPKRILVVPEAGHGMSYFLNREEYERALKDFWNDYDLGEKYRDVCEKHVAFIFESSSL